MTSPRNSLVMETISAKADAICMFEDAYRIWPPSKSHPAHNPDRAGGGGTFHGKKGIIPAGPSARLVAPGADAAPMIARQTRWMAAVMTSSDATAFLWRLASY